MRSSPASRTPLRGARRWTPARSLDGARTQGAAARALSIGSGDAAGSGSRDFSAWAWGIGAGAQELGLQGVQAGGRCCPALRVSRREAGLGPAARCYPRVVSSARKTAIPTVLSPKSGNRELVPGGPPRRVRPAHCVRRDSNRGLSGAPSRAGGSRLGFPWSHPSRGGEDQEGTPEMQDPSSVPALQQKPALLSPVLLFSEPLLAPAARSQTRERKKKRGGGGAADSGVLPVLPWEDSSAATGGEGLREASGEGARFSAGSGADGPAS